MEKISSIKAKNQFHELPLKSQIINGVRAKRFTGNTGPSNIKTMNEPFGQIDIFFQLMRDKLITEHKEHRFPFSIAKRGNIEDLKEAIKLIIKLIKKDVSQIGEKEANKAEHVINLLEESLAHENIDSIYANIIKTYTDETFLYKRTNNLLRVEAYESMKNLLPYIIYLLKAMYALSQPFCYFLMETKAKIPSTLTLFRGAKLKKEMISAYKTPMTPYFSWNGFTSTTMSREIAEIAFMSSSEKEEPKDLVPVLFNINVEFNNETKISRQLFFIAKYSMHPEEAEVVIAPGTVFQVLGVEEKLSIFGVEKKQSTYKINLSAVECTLDTLINSRKAFPDKSNEAFRKLNRTLEKIPERVIISDFIDTDITKVITLLFVKRELIQTLIVNSCIFSADGVKQLMEGLQNFSNLHTLILYRPFKHMPLECAEIVAQSLLQSPLKRLAIEDENVYMLYKVLAYNSFKNFRSLSVSFRRISTYRGYMKYIGNLFKELPQTSISELCLDPIHNFEELTDQVLESLRKSNVQKLMVKQVKMKRCNVAALIKCLMGTKIKHLCIYKSVFTDWAIQYIAKALPQIPLETLSLESSYDLCMDSSPITLNTVQNFAFNLSQSTIKNLFIRKLLIRSDSLLELIKKVLKFHFISLLFYVIPVPNPDLQRDCELILGDYIPEQLMQKLHGTCVKQFGPVNLNQFPLTKYNKLKDLLATCNFYDEDYYYGVRNSLFDDIFQSIPRKSWAEFKVQHSLNQDHLC